MHTESVLTLLKTLQNQICAALEQEDGEAKFVHEAWTGKLGIGETRVLKKTRSPAFKLSSEMLRLAAAISRAVRGRLTLRAFL